MLRVLPILIVAVLLSAGVSFGEAHIGDTETTLVARYGAVRVRTAEHTLVEGRAVVLGERLMFKNADWRVNAVMIHGRCAKITYALRGPWTEAHFTGLLSANVGDGTWREVGEAAPKWQRTWRRSDGLVAKWMYVGGFIIESHAFVDARDHLQARAADRSRGTPSS